MTSEEQKPRARGLPSIQEAREARASGKSRWPSVRFWGYTALVLILGFILRWKWLEDDNSKVRAKLLADQRGVAVEIAPRWQALRDPIEQWVTSLAASPGAEVVDKEALASWDFRAMHGIYLRLRVEDAKTAEAIRQGARDSLRDAFTACLTRVNNPHPTEEDKDGAKVARTPCKRTRDCPKQQFCNEQDHCAPAAQPYNLRLAYRTMFFLTDEWMNEVKESGELRLHAFRVGFDDTIKDDMPLAVDMIAKAQYFMVVLDETPPEGLPKDEASAADPAARKASPAELVQSVAHAARVGVWRLSDKKLVMRVRRDAGGSLIGLPPNVDPKTMAAAMRQANSCALALAVRQAMGDPNAAAKLPDHDAPAPPPTSSASAPPPSSSANAPPPSASASPSSAPHAPPKKLNDR